jgi:hypothetical protein
MESRESHIEDLHRKSWQSVSHQQGLIVPARQNGSPDFDVNAHPSVEEIAAYLSGRMSPESVQRVDAHLSLCSACRGEVVSARAVLSERDRRPRRWMIPALVAAGVLAAIVVRPSAESDRQRGTDKSAASGRASFAAIAPLRETSAAGVQFIWNDLGDGPLYHITLSDSSGGEVWEAETADTTITLPDSLVLRVGERYLWYVDASTQGGLTATTGVHSFRTDK